MVTRTIKFLTAEGGKAFWLLAALIGLVVMSFFTLPASQATPAPPPGTGGWQVQANAVCSAPASGQPTCEFSGSVLETGNSESALQSSHGAVLVDAASALHVTFTSVAVKMDDGNYSGTASIYDAKKRLVAVRKVTFYVTDNTAYLSNPDAISSWDNVRYFSHFGEAVAPIWLNEAVTNHSPEGDHHHGTGYTEARFGQSHSD